MENEIILKDPERELTKQEKISISLKDIAQTTRQKLKEKYPGCKFSVTTEYYSMGQSLHISLMESDFKVIQDFKDIPEMGLFKITSEGHYADEQIKQMQSEMYHQLNEYQLQDAYDSEHWCNGVFLTEQGHKMLQDVVKITRVYNWDDSDSMIDYFDVKFYLHVNIGKWDKPYILN